MKIKIEKIKENIKLWRTCPEKYYISLGFLLVNVVSTDASETELLQTSLGSSFFLRICKMIYILSWNIVNIEKEPFDEIFFYSKKLKISSVVYWKPARWSKLGFFIWKNKISVEICTEKQPVDQRPSFYMKNQTLNEFYIEK